ncbi:MAG: hypothetical protein NUW00_00205 [Candidatus Kaiserbacteria bacterium]|nr:hypothetical protein [Candidatus Kaiserbacteria bacterium]
MQAVGYSSFLRISALVTALVLVFDSGILMPVTSQLSDTTILYVASIGVGASASVPESEINALSAQIAERQRVLDAKEAELNEREIATRSFSVSGTTENLSTYVLSTILFILTVLIVLNYAMDWARVRSYRYERQVG